ncbi:MAG: glycosyl hydrolase family 28-related protein, partial [Thermoguttaceae bacterium]
MTRLVTAVSGSRATAQAARWLVESLRVITLLTSVLTATAALGEPRVFWASDPVRPDETVLIVGCDFGKAPSVELARVEDSDAAAAAQRSAITGWTRPQVLQGGDGSLKFVVPARWKPGLFACRVVGPDGASTEQILNAPDPWWWQGDGGSSASPAGWLRVFGKSLQLGKASRAELRSADGRSLALPAEEADAYSLRFALPADLAAGEYELLLHNGCGGQSAWRTAGKVAVRPAQVWKQDVLNVRDFGAQPGEALLAALKKAESNGGGIVYLPRGRYPVKSTLTIPKNTVLRGEAMELVSLYWPDFEKPPAELVTGTDFGIESLSLYCQNHKNVISDTPASTRLLLRHVRIRANCYFMIEEAGKEFRNRRGPASHKECGAAVMLRGTNFEVADCDIYASKYGLRILKAKTGIIARNQIRYGGRGYSIENTDRLIFEDNLVAGNNLLSIGNDITTFWTNYCRNIFFARNRVQQMFGADREMMTLDAGGGAYYGHVAAVDGTRLTLAADPVFRDYAPKPHTDWSGAAVMILDGRGAGQYRLVTKSTGRRWQVDRPWLVPPDATSRISIAPFRGRSLFVGNRFEDGGAFQLYGSALESIVAGNQGARMDGFFVWGLNPHGWGQQPSWFCQFLDNEISEGNGYGNRSAAFGTIG